MSRTRTEIVNLYGDDWDATRDREGWHAKGVPVGERIGGELLGASLSEVEPGSKLWPYHTHYLNEEWLIVVRGAPTLRTPEGEQILKEGDVVCFPRGKEGAHQIINRSDAPIRVLMLSSMIRGEIIEYLDTGKVLAKDIEDEDVMFARPGPTADYWEGEEEPTESTAGESCLACHASCAESTRRRSVRSLPWSRKEDRHPTSR